MTAYHMFVYQTHGIPIRYSSFMKEVSDGSDDDVL